MSTVLSADYATDIPPSGPYTADNSTWNVGNLVNGTGYTSSLTLDDPNTPNINTTISWNFPNTPTSGNVYAFPSVHYGQDGAVTPANNITPEQVNNITTLTLSDNISLSGQTDQYDAIVDGFLTPKPDASGASATSEFEVYLHTPSYTQGWIESLPQHTFTDSQGMQWIIASGGPGGSAANQIVFAPANFQDLTNTTIDLKALLQAAAADGLISGNDYFNALAIGNEPREGSGSMTIHSFSVNYDGDHTGTASTETTTVNTGSTTTAGSTTTTGSTTGTGDTTHTGGTTATSDPMTGSTTTADSTASTGDTTHTGGTTATSDPTTGSTTTAGSTASTGDTTHTGGTTATSDPTGTGGTTTTGSTASTGDTTHTGGTTATSDPTGTGGTTTTGSTASTGDTTHTGGTAGTSDPTGTGGTTHHTGGHHHIGGTTATGETTHHHHHTGGTTDAAATAPASATQVSNPPATTSDQEASSNTHHGGGGHCGHDAAIHDLMAYVHHQVQSFEHMWH